MAPFSSYSKEELIGKGYYGKVYLATNPRGRRMAFKEINLANKNSSQIDKAVHEAEMIQRFNSPFIIKSYGHFFSLNCLTIVMEYAEYGNLFHHVKNYKRLYDEDRVLNVFAQLVVGLKYLHDREIVHRDLSAVNILVMCGWNMKIADFGIAKTYEAYDPNNAYVRGNPVYMAPELITGKMNTYKTDIWSLGIVLFYMATLKFPYVGDDKDEVLHAITHYDRPYMTCYMPDVEELIDLTLSFYPRHRPSCKRLMSDDLLIDFVDIVCDRF